MVFKLGQISKSQILILKILNFEYFKFKYYLNHGFKLFKPITIKPIKGQTEPNRTRTIYKNLNLNLNRTVKTVKMRFRGLVQVQSEMLPIVCWHGSVSEE